MKLLHFYADNRAVAIPNMTTLHNTQAASSISVGAVLGKAAFPGASEPQSSIGLSQEVAQDARENWDYYASCDSGGLYVSRKGQVFFEVF